MKTNEIINEGPWDYIRNTAKNLGQAVQSGGIQGFKQNQAVDRRNSNYTDRLKRNVNIVTKKWDSKERSMSNRAALHNDPKAYYGELLKFLDKEIKAGQTGNLTIPDIINPENTKEIITKFSQKAFPPTALPGEAPAVAPVPVPAPQGSFVPQEGLKLNSKNGDQYKFTKQRWTKYNPTTKKWNVVPVKPNPANPAVKTQSQLTTQAKRNADKKAQRAASPAAPRSAPPPSVTTSTTPASTTTPAAPKAGDPVPGMSGYVYTGKVDARGRPGTKPAPATTAAPADTDATSTLPTKAKSKTKAKDIDIDAALKMADTLSPEEKKKLLQDLLKSGVTVRAGGA
jgi:hypothetical protein